MLFVGAILVATSLVRADDNAHEAKPASDAESHPVLRAARAFPDGGAYNKKWTGSGTPEEVRFKDARILAKGDGGTYCSGFTFAGARRAATAAGLLDGKSVEEVRRFQKQWYGAVPEPDARERQCAVAVETLGIGKAVPFDDARPGDFAQLWRTSKSGHSVVFLGWVEDDHGKRIGLRYRSSQGSTNGVADHTEYFSDAPADEAGKVLRDRTYFCRLNVPAESKRR
jgi:hypothetical protein